ncbi:hypothetical protein ACU4GD_45750 [Cupriavidus basilensis]
MFDTILDWAASGLANWILVGDRDLHAGGDSHHHRRRHDYTCTAAWRTMSLDRAPHRRDTSSAGWLWLTTGMVTKEWTAIHRKHTTPSARPKTIPTARRLAASARCCWKARSCIAPRSKNKETITKFGHGTPDDWVEAQCVTRDFGVAGRWPDADHSTSPDVRRMIGTDRVGGADVVDPDPRCRHHQWSGPLLGLPQLRLRRRFDQCLAVGHHHRRRRAAQQPPHLRRRRRSSRSSGMSSISAGATIRAHARPLGLAKVKKTGAQGSPWRRARPVDHNTLEAIIANRYDVMARYAKAVKSAYKQEPGQAEGSPLAEYSKLQARPQVVPPRGNQAGRSAAPATGQQSSRHRSAAHLCRRCRELAHLGPLQRRRANSCCISCRVVPSRRGQRHRGAARFLAAPAPLCLMRLRCLTPRRGLIQFSRPESPAPGGASVFAKLPQCRQLACEIQARGPRWYRR